VSEMRIMDEYPGAHARIISSKGYPEHGQDVRSHEAPVYLRAHEVSREHTLQDHTLDVSLESVVRCVQVVDCTMPLVATFRSPRFLSTFNRS
jgi:hypothetical protein